MLSYFLPFTRYPYVGETTVCPVCGSTNAEPIARIDRRLKRLTTSLCGDCGLFYTTPMPTQDELDAYYRDMYRLDYQFAVLKPGGRHKRKKTREADRRYAIAAAHLDLTRPRATLDFGCGSGELAHRFSQSGHDAYGLEPGATYARHAASDDGAKIQCAPWRDAAFDEGQFDLITCLHVLEHLRDPVDALKRMAFWLKPPPAVLYLEVPDMQGYDFKSFEHFHFAHVLGFSSSNLIHAAQQAGFCVVEMIEPTSLILAKGGSQQALDFTADIERNRRDYGRRISPREYLGFHAKRLTRR